MVSVASLRSNFMSSAAKLLAAMSITAHIEEVFTIRTAPLILNAKGMIFPDFTYCVSRTRELMNV